MSDYHDYGAGFKITAFPVASQAVLTCHLRIPPGHKEDNFWKNKMERNKWGQGAKEMVFEMPSY